MFIKLGMKLILSEKNLSKFFIFTPIILIILTTVLVTFSQIRQIEKTFEEDTKKLKSKLIYEEKLKLSQKINSVSEYIFYKSSTTKTILKKRIKKRVTMAYSILLDKYNKEIGVVPEQKLKKDLIEILKSINFNDNTYYFLKKYIDKNTIIPLINPATPWMVNKNLMNIKTKNEHEFAQRFVKLVESNNEGYIAYPYKKLNEEKSFAKVSYLKKFEPYNWVIGYGEYIDDINRLIKEEVIERLDSLRYDNNEIVYTFSKDLKLIQHPKLKNEGITLERYLSKDSLQNIENFLKYGNFYEPFFYWSDNYSKLNVLKFIPTWNWVITTGIDMQNLEQSIIDVLGSKQKEKEQSIEENIKVAVIVIILGSIITLFISRKVERIFTTYRNNIESQRNALKHMNATLEENVKVKTQQLEELNQELQDKVRFEVLKNRRKDQMLYNQSKLAAMGEMIGNIAHQWRQPLSTISTAASGISIKIDFGISDEKEIQDDLKSIVSTTKHLSQTIEDFRNFFIDNKEKETFNLVEVIEKNLSIVESSMKNNFVEVIEDFDEVTMFGIKNELTQAILNILTNAKDVLIEKVDLEESKRLIFIKISKDEKYAYIDIKDNGGGIKETLLDKIFEPYFTTKHKSQGTGIGLYMTREIICKHMNGDINVANISYEYQGKTYLGADFEIKLPLNIEDV